MWVEALAIKGGKLVFLGLNEAVKPFISTSTEVIDLEGLMVIPQVVSKKRHFHFQKHCYQSQYHHFSTFFK